MERTIKRVTFHTLAAPKLKRVAAYARVSSDKDPMGHSLSVQISYFNDLIQKHLDWTLVGIYADKGITGTRADRPEFMRLLADCRAGKIDMQLTAFDPVMAIIRNSDFAEAARKTPYFQKIIPAMRDYFETGHYVFVHGWIPCIRDRNGYSYYSDWRNASADEWAKARWYNGMDATVTCQEEKTIVCGHDDGIAGIVGHLNSGTVTNCTNYGNIYSAFYSGGIVGYCMGNVSNCKNYGNILTPSASAGGIIGYIGSVNSATYQNNINYGDVTTDYYAGGIIGSGGNWSGHPVRSCINFGRITSNTRGAGGICGWQYGMMSNCRNYGDIIGKQSAGGLSGRIYFGSVFYCGNYASVLSDDSAGGLVGSISSDSRPTIDSSFNTGNVSGTSYAGGIIGQPSSSSSAGEISNCYNTGNVTAEGYAGGIIADDIYYNIEYCYNIGAVHSPENAGMIAAASDYIWGKSRVSFCYYRETEGLFGLGRLEDEPKTAEAKTDQELMLESTFIAWNFSKTWSIATDKNGGYPYLQWQEGTLSDIAVNAVQISETALSLAEGDHEYLTARVSPANAKDQSVTWKSSDSTVATVSANGKVTAVAPGDATVTVTTTDGGFTATCAVTVTKRKPEEYKINSITVLDDDGKELPAVPTGDFLASVSITNLTSEGDTLVLLAAYTAEGKYKGLMWESVKDLPVGDTSEVTLPVENSAGTITQLKAFTIASFSNLVPIGSAVSFPMQ